MTHPIAWFELQVPDLEAAKKFYGELFGWSFTEFDGAAGYVIISSGETMYGGLQQADGDLAGRRVNVVFDADAVAAATLEDLLARTEAAGGRIETGRTLIAEGMGWYATVTDPSGLRIDLSTSRPADGDRDRA